MDLVYFLFRRVCGVCHIQRQYYINYLLEWNSSLTNVTAIQMDYSWLPHLNSKFHIAYCYHYIRNIDSQICFYIFPDIRIDLSQNLYFHIDKRIFHSLHKCIDWSDYARIHLGMVILAMELVVVVQWLLFLIIVVNKYVYVIDIYMD